MTTTFVAQKTARHVIRYCQLLEVSDISDLDGLTEYLL